MTSMGRVRNMVDASSNESASPRILTNGYQRTSLKEPGTRLRERSCPSQNTRPNGDSSVLKGHLPRQDLRAYCQVTGKLLEMS